MRSAAFTLAVRLGGMLAVSGCGSSEGDVSGAASRIARCIDGRSFWFAERTTPHAPRARLGTIHAAAPEVTRGEGDAGAFEAATELTYDVDAAGTRVLAKHGLCAPGVRCFPHDLTATIFPDDVSGYDFSFALVDAFAPFHGGRVIALEPHDLRNADGCP